MKIILIETCSDCPHYVNACMGKKPVCGHPQMMVKYPYSDNRKVEGDKIPPSFCPLNNCEEIIGEHKLRSNIGLPNNSKIVWTKI